MKINSLKSKIEIIRNTSLPICKEIISSMINQQLHVRAAYLLNTKRIFLISLFLFADKKDCKLQPEKCPLFSISSWYVNNHFRLKFYFGRRNRFIVLIRNPPLSLVIPLDIYCIQTLFIS